MVGRGLDQKSSKVGGVDIFCHKKMAAAYSHRIETYLKYFTFLEQHLVRN